MVAVEREPVLPSADEAASIKQLDDLLTKARKDKKAHRSRLIGPEGQTLIIPDSVSRLLTRLVHDLARGNAVTVIPVQAELTTQQAAELLSVSRPFLIRLLEAGEIPYHMVGTHRRVRFKDLMHYRQRRSEARKAMLAGMARESQDLGLYE